VNARKHAHRRFHPTRHDPACKRAAARIQAAYDRALTEGEKTSDLGGSLGTRAFTRAVIERLPANAP
jgi:isocitrate/isopropylmalate dehydrogenase